jgi:hypothetical protein
VKTEEIQRLFDNLPEGYEERAAALHSLTRTFKHALAKALEPAMNQALRRMPKSSFQDRQHVSAWIRHQLQSFGLAIRCPQTNRPASIIASTKDGIGDRSRFRLRIRLDNGKQAYTLTRQELPDIELMSAESPEPSGFVQRLGLRQSQSDEPQR